MLALFNHIYGCSREKYFLSVITRSYEILNYHKEDYVGVDIAKKHYICILDDTKELACKPFWIYNDILGLRELLKQLADLSLDSDDFIINIESTEAFSESFYSYITDADYKVILLNSYQTAKYRDFSTLKKIKNDSIDAYVISELLTSGKYKASYISNEDYHNLKV